MFFVAGALSPVNGTSPYWTNVGTSTCSAATAAWCANAGNCAQGCRCRTSVAFVAPRAVAAVSVVLLAIPIIVALALTCSGSRGCCVKHFSGIGAAAVSDSLVERRVSALYITAAVSIYAGCLGLIASGAFISSTLSIASGAIAVATLRSAGSAGDIIAGRTPSVTHPTHAFQLAVGE